MQTILILDDDETIGDLAQEVLTRAGYRNLRAYAGTEALLLLKAQQPDPILLDLMLPGLSGEALLPKLAGSSVIVVSADTPDCTKRALRQHISNLRRKLASHIGRDCIEAVWGIGFRLKLWQKLDRFLDRLLDFCLLNWRRQVKGCTFIHGICA